MPLIKLETHIHAPIEVCFNLARSLDLHMDSMKHTSEKAIAGKTSGLMQKGERVTWRATHLGWNHTMTVLMLDMNPPYYFEDIMIKGPFKYMKHQHYFKDQAGNTLMIDQFHFAAPFGWIGKMADTLLLKTYMTNLLKQRNRYIKKQAETDGNLLRTKMNN